MFRVGDKVKFQIRLDGSGLPRWDFDQDFNNGEEGPWKESIVQEVYGDVGEVLADDWIWPIGLIGKRPGYLEKIVHKKFRIVDKGSYYASEFVEEDDSDTQDSSFPEYQS
jgi:hypothetical protein